MQVEAGRKWRRGGACSSVGAWCKSSSAVGVWWRSVVQAGSVCVRGRGARVAGSAGSRRVKVREAQCGACRCKAQAAAPGGGARAVRAVSGAGGAQAAAAGVDVQAVRVVVQAGRRVFEEAVCFFFFRQRPCKAPGAQAHERGKGVRMQEKRVGDRAA